MNQSPRIAIIGGSKEAVELAHLLANTETCLFETSFYPSPKRLRTQTYTSNTDWPDVLQGFEAVVFAPHPFAFDVFDKIKAIDTPHIALLRPPWIPAAQDDWTLVSTLDAGAQALRESGVKSPLLAIGRERLDPFLTNAGPKLRVRCRNLPKPDLQGCGVVEYMTGPFSVEQERAYLQKHHIDCIVVHNAGGPGGWPKLQAAQELDIPVIMIQRGLVDWPLKVETPKQVLAWLRQDVGLDV